jgi:phosphopantetheinyl transferase (holo-ACP synthase)
MPRPFPLAIGIGTDICHVARIYRILTKPKGSAQQFIRQFLNPREILAYASKLKVAEELDRLKADEKRYSEIPAKMIAAKAWPLAHFLGGR